jgi:hypothetical protein
MYKAACKFGYGFCTRRKSWPRIAPICTCTVHHSGSIVSKLNVKGWDGNFTEYQRAGVGEALSYNSETKTVWRNLSRLVSCGVRHRVVWYQNFGGRCAVFSVTDSCPENWGNRTSVPVYQTTRRQILEDRVLETHCCESLTYQK